MFYSYALTIPANTPERSPTEQEVKLTHGVITHVEVEFPPGCAGLVHAYIRKGVHQVWPTNPDGSFRSDGRAIVWADYEELFYEPYSLTIGGWNEDDTYDHEVLFRFEITPREVAERGVKEFSILRRIGRLILGK